MGVKYCETVQMLQSVEADYSLIHKNTGPRKNSSVRAVGCLREQDVHRSAGGGRGGERRPLQHPERFAALCSVRCSLSQRRTASWTTAGVKNGDDPSRIAPAAEISSI